MNQSSQILFIFSVLALVNSQLPKYNVDLKNTTVSGVGAGGYMAVQVHIAFSRYVSGAGVIGAGPYLCAQGNPEISITSCMISPWLIDVQLLLQEMRYYSNQGRISPLEKVAGSRVLLISGSKDTVVVQGVAQKLELMYNRLLADIKVDFSIPAENVWITDNYGKECAFLGKPYINNCGINIAQRIFEYIFDQSEPINPPVPAVVANLKRFSQKSYQGIGYSMAETGYIYVPTSCQNGALCQIHIAFHGCRQTMEAIGEVFIEHVQINEIAESNNIIVLYPQTQNSDIYPYNPLGCWDWWGYTDIPVIPGEILNYPTQHGKQMSAIWKMVEDLSGMSNTLESEIEIF